MKKRYIILFFVALLFILQVAYSETAYNFLTKGYADTLYCKLTDGCSGTSSAAGGNNTLIIADECLDATCNTILVVEQNVN